MVDKAFNDGAGFTGAWRRTGATVGAVGTAVSLKGGKKVLLKEHKVRPKKPQNMFEDTRAYDLLE